MRGWEFPPEFTAQIKLSIRSFFCSLFSCSSPSTYCTHIPWGPTNSHVRHLSRPVILTVFWMLISGSNFFQIYIFIISTFPQASFCSFHFTSYVFPPLSPQPPNFLLLAQSWPGLPVLFLACLSVYLSVCVGAGNSETSPQRTALISSRQTWAKKVQPDSTAEKVILPPLSGMLLI